MYSLARGSSLKSVKGTNKLTFLPQIQVLPDFARITRGAFPLGISVFQRFHKVCYRRDSFQVVPRDFELIVSAIGTWMEHSMVTGPNPPARERVQGPGSPVGPRSPARGALGDSR